MVSRFILGLGTGRCGTRSLAKLLALQPGVSCVHERKPALSWHGDSHPQRHFDAGAQDVDCDIFADVGFYYLPYVRELLSRFAGMRCICLCRDRQQTIDSFCKSLPKASEWFTDRADGWHRAFPSYDDREFPDAAGQYYDDYYREAERLQTEFTDRFRVYPIEALNVPLWQERMLRFAGIEEPHVITDIHETDAVR